MSPPSGTAAALSRFDQLRLSRPDLDDAALVRELCEELLADAGAKPPVDVRILASLRGISRIDVLDQPMAGLLLPERERLSVCVRLGDPPPRQRFTVLHETVHTFMPGFTDGPQLRCDPGSVRDRVEVLCDIGASELLFPRQPFLVDLDQADPGLDQVVALADRYEASVEATARRRVELSEGPMALLVLRVGTKPSDRPGALPRLRLAYRHASAGWPFMPRDKSVSLDGPLGRALDGEPIDGAHDLSELQLLGGDVWVSARTFGEDRVLALVSPTAHRNRI